MTCVSVLTHSLLLMDTLQMRNWIPYLSSGIFYFSFVIKEMSHFAAMNYQKLLIAKSFQQNSYIWSKSCIQEWLLCFSIRKNSDRGKAVIPIVKVQGLKRPNSWDKFMAELWFTISVSLHNNKHLLRNWYDRVRRWTRKTHERCV